MDRKCHDDGRHCVLGLRPTAYNYFELPTPIRRSRSRRNRLRCQRRVKQFTNRPHMIRNAERHCRRTA
jgi:hypothetical protein